MRGSADVRRELSPFRSVLSLSFAHCSAVAMLVFWLVGQFVLACTAQHAEVAATPPSPPSLHWLFTAHLDIVPNTAPLIPGPRGIRLNLPITGGTVHGKHGMNGALRLFPLPFASYADFSLGTQERSSRTRQTGSSLIPSAASDPLTLGGSFRRPSLPSPRPLPRLSTPPRLRDPSFRLSLRRSRRTTSSSTPKAPRCRTRPTRRRICESGSKRAVSPGGGSTGSAVRRISRYPRHLSLE